jgi:hypothetical protein
MNRWYWKLTSVWDPPPLDLYTRHEVEHSIRIEERIQAAKPLHGTALRLRSLRKSHLEDFPFCFVPLMSSRAVEQLQPLIGPCGEFVPADITAKGVVIARYYLFNCLRQYDAFDLERSNDDRERGFEFGTVDPLLRLSYSKVPTDVHAFRCAGYMQRLLVSEEVGERLEKSSLSGWMLADPQDPPFRRRPIVSPNRPST